jgi:predicted DNA-binding transcriptional regulator AlpA
MEYNNKKHYYDPYDSLDVEWKTRISHDRLSVGEAAVLSGFSRQYINRLIANGIIIAKKNKEGNYEIRWKNLIKWYSALPVTPQSPIGYASYSLKELIRYTGMSRCWVLKFVTRNEIPSYYVGVYRRFCKSACEEAWKRESIALKRWLTLEEASAFFDLDPSVIYAFAALHRVRVKRLNKSLVYNKADIMSVVKNGGALCQE